MSELGPDPVLRQCPPHDRFGRRKRTRGVPWRRPDMNSLIQTQYGRSLLRPMYCLPRGDFRPAETHRNPSGDQLQHKPAGVATIVRQVIGKLDADAPLFCHDPHFRWRRACRSRSESAGQLSRTSPYRIGTSRRGVCAVSGSLRVPILGSHFFGSAKCPQRVQDQ